MRVIIDPETGGVLAGPLCSCPETGELSVVVSDVLEARHFDDDVMAYGFHDSAPRLQIKDGGTYGIPYRALCVAGVDNLFATGMMITADHNAHMSTRNTVCCMGQGQAAGTAAASAADQDWHALVSDLLAIHRRASS